MTWQEDDQRQTGEIRVAALVKDTKVRSIKHELEEDAWCEQVRKDADEYYRRKKRDNALAVVAGIIGMAVLGFAVWCVVSYMVAS